MVNEDGDCDGDGDVDVDGDGDGDGDADADADDDGDTPLLYFSRCTDLSCAPSKAMMHGPCGILALANRLRGYTALCLTGDSSGVVGIPRWRVCCAGPRRIPHDSVTAII